MGEENKQQQKRDRPQAFLKKLEINNFKACDGELSVDIGPGLNMLIGRNNSGKSTIMQALLLWEHTKRIAYRAKKDMLTRRKRVSRSKRRGVPIDVGSIPLNISTMAPLWYDSAVDPGYSMFIQCSWAVEEGEEKFLKMLFGYAGDVSMNIDCASNLEPEEVETHLNNLPTIAYLPHFTSPVAQEPYHQDNLLSLMVAEGKTGEVLRNVLYRLRQNNTNGYEKVVSMLEKYFSFKNDEESKQIIDIPFEEAYDAYITVNRAQPRPKFAQKTRDRDLLLEGSGCLQWLSVFSYAYRKEIDVLLLDEPDAHMHGNLQVALFKELLKVCEEQNKQVIIATHSARMVEESKEHLAAVDVIGMDLMGKNLGERVQPLKTAEAIRRFFLSEMDEKAVRIEKPTIFVEGPTDEDVYTKVVEDCFASYKDRVDIRGCGGCGAFPKVEKKEKGAGKEYCFIADSDATPHETPNTFIRLKADFLPEEYKSEREALKKERSSAKMRVPGEAKARKIELENFYSPKVQGQFSKLRDQQEDKMKSAEYVASGKDMESLENFKPVIKEALARLFHNGDTKGVECMGTSIGPKPMAHEQACR